MAKLIDRYKGWRDRRKERYLAKWATTRQKGKSHYVAGTALVWCLAMTVSTTLMNYLWGDPDNIANFTVRLVIFFFGGLAVGLVAWNDLEKNIANRSLPYRPIVRPTMHKGPKIYSSNVSEVRLHRIGGRIRSRQRRQTLKPGEQRVKRANP